LKGKTYYIELKEKIIKIRERKTPFQGEGG
jgi:hypothetical protein